MTTLMITDGGDHVSDGVLANILSKKGQYDHITTVLAGRNMTDSGMRGLSDDTIIARKRDLQVSLQKVGNSLL